MNYFFSLAAFVLLLAFNACEDSDSGNSSIKMYMSEVSMDMEYGTVNTEHFYNKDMSLLKSRTEQLLTGETDVVVSESDYTYNDKGLAVKACWYYNDEFL